MGCPWRMPRHFAAFGLGKSVMQIETLRLIHKHSGGRFWSFARSGSARSLSGMPPCLAWRLEFIRRPEEMVEECDFYLTNYESVRDGKLDPNLFTAVSLDEASVLRSFGSDTYQTFLTIFKTVKYRFVATATPSPNRFKELIHYAGFLGIMDTGQSADAVLQARQHKGKQPDLVPAQRAGILALDVIVGGIHQQAVRPWLLGYGYTLPPLRVHYHELPTDHSDAGHDRDGQGVLVQGYGAWFVGCGIGKEDSLDARIAKAKRLLTHRRMNISSSGTTLKPNVRQSKGVS